MHGFVDSICFGESNANLSRNRQGKYNSKFPTPADVVYYFERLVWSIKSKFNGGFPDE